MLRDPFAFAHGDHVVVLPDDASPLMWSFKWRPVSIPTKLTLTVTAIRQSSTAAVAI
jgi:hypothetical protein